MGEDFHASAEEESFQGEMRAVYQNFGVVPFVRDLQARLQRKILGSEIIRVSSHNHNVVLRHILWRLIALFSSLEGEPCLLT